MEMEKMGVQSCRKLKIEELVAVGTGQRGIAAWQKTARLHTVGPRERRKSRQTIKHQVNVVDDVDIGRKGVVNWAKIAISYILGLLENLNLVDIGKRAIANSEINAIFLMKEFRISLCRALLTLPHILRFLFLSLYLHLVLPPFHLSFLILLILSFLILVILSFLILLILSFLILVLSFLILLILSFLILLIRSLILISQILHIRPRQVILKREQKFAVIGQKDIVN